MSLPGLANWQATRDALHQVALVVNSLRVACVAPLRNDRQYSLELTAAGLTTAELSFAGELVFDIAELKLVYELDGNSVFLIPVESHTQRTLMREVLSTFAAQGKDVNPSLTHITHDEPFVIDRSQAVDYLLVLQAAAGALSSLRAKLPGYTSTVVVWAHHFDLAFLWFPVESMDEHLDPHLAFGFSPFSPGLERPYFYAYGWSPSAGYVTVPLQPPAIAITEGYTGLYAAYDVLRQGTDFSFEVESILTEYFELARAQL